MMNHGFIKVATASPRLKVANVGYNISRIEDMVHEANKRGAKILVFPELSITGYTCGDLFLQKNLLNGAIEALISFSSITKNIDMLVVVGLPLLLHEGLYDCACVIQKGHILGLVPKMFIPNYKEFYEKRWFTSGYEISKEISEVIIEGNNIAFGNIIFTNQKYNLNLGIEICEDLWSVIPPSSYLAVNGANIIANPSASNELVGKADYRRKLIEQQSARCISGYIYSGSSAHESTTDLVFGSHCMIAENGVVLSESQRFVRTDQIVYSDVDLDRLSAERCIQTSFRDDCVRNRSKNKYKIVEFNFDEDIVMNKLDRKVYQYPFVPDDPVLADKRCEEVFKIQTAGLAKRIEHIGINKAVIAVSGGIDSTLALLVTAITFDLLDIPRKNIIAITMPGFGTTSITYKNAIKLMETLDVNFMEIDIKPACLLHMNDIGHDPATHDITFENIQARERTQILMDVANKVNGLVVGTGDLSELALGWATYNGDHMSMYGINSGVPKTLVRFLVKWVADNVSEYEEKQVLHRILDTPITPELLPPDKEGGISQKTEKQIGSFDLHDFFLYHVIKWGMAPNKILFLANEAFAGKYDANHIKETLRLFYSRFFSQQFKRSALPDGPKVGSIGLSPRGDWRMPSDADSSLWTIGI